MTKLLRASAFLSVLCTPALGVAGLAEDVEAVAVVDVLDLSDELVDSMGLLDYDGPVLLAWLPPVEDGVTEFWMRMDFDPDGDSPFAIPELDVVAWGDGLVPVVLNDRRDEDALRAAIDLSGAQVRAVIDTHFVDPRMLEALGSDGADALVSVTKDVDADTVSTARLPDVRFLAPEAARAAVLDAAVVGFEADDYRGSLCDGADLDECEVARDLESNTWIDWVVGPLTDEGAGRGGDEVDEEEVEEDEAPDTDTDDTESTDDPADPETADPEGEAADDGDDAPAGSTATDPPETADPAAPETTDPAPAGLDTASSSDLPAPGDPEAPKPPGYFS